MIPFRPCTIEHFKTLSKDFDRCLQDRISKDVCNRRTFGRANCIQWTTLDTRMDYLDFLGRPRMEPKNITFSGMESIVDTLNID